MNRVDMNKKEYLILGFVLMIALFVVLSNISFALADDNNSNSRKNSSREINSNDSNDDNDELNDSDDDDNTSLGDNSDDDEDKEKREFKKEFNDESGREVKVDRKIEFEDGKIKIEIERSSTDANGNVRKIKIEIEEENGKRKIKIDGEDEFDADTGLELDSEFEGNESDLKAVTSDGRKHKIKVLPDRAAEIVMERLNTLNISNLTLEEIIERNIPRIVYNIESNKHGRFLGVFKLALKTEIQIDPETGEIISINGPWWAFLIVGGGENSPDETLIKGKTKIKAETFNGTSEIEIEIKFGTESIDREAIVNEILAKLNLSNEDINNSLKVEESDEPFETEEKLVAEAKIKNKVTKVEFELKFVVGSDNREEIVNAILTRLSELTKDDINNVLVLKTKDKND